MAPQTDHVRVARVCETCLSLLPRKLWKQWKQQKLSEIPNVRLPKIKQEECWVLKQTPLSCKKPLSGHTHLFFPQSSCLRIKHLNPSQKACLSSKSWSNSERDPYLPPISILSPFYLWSHPHGRLTLVFFTLALPSFNPCSTQHF